MSNLDPRVPHVISKDKSANAYRARKKGDSTHATVKSVALLDVKFIQTGSGSDFEYETGFGCGIVAMGCPAEAAPVSDVFDLQPIFFDGSCFRVEKTWEIIKSARLVVLNESGAYAAV